MSNMHEYFIEDKTGGNKTEHLKRVISPTLTCNFDNLKTFGWD